VFWSDFDPRDLEIADLARDATEGDSYCSFQETVEVTDERQYPQTEFFAQLED
jgi:hypothetical protein